MCLCVARLGAGVYISMVECISVEASGVHIAVIPNSVFRIIHLFWVGRDEPPKVVTEPAIVPCQSGL